MRRGASSHELRASRDLLVRDCRSLLAARGYSVPISRYWLRKYSSGSPSRTSTCSTSAMKNGVIAGRLRANEAALQVCERALKHRRAVRRPFKSARRLFRRADGPRRACVVFRDCLLVAAEHIYPKPLSRVKMSVGSRAMVHANQHQRRIERHRCESVRGHAVDFAVLVYGNDRYASRETSHRFAEIASSQVHGGETSVRKLTT